MIAKPKSLENATLEYTMRKCYVSKKLDNENVGAVGMFIVFGMQRFSDILNYKYRISSAEHIIDKCTTIKKS